MRLGAAKLGRDFIHRVLAAGDTQPVATRACSSVFGLAALVLSAPAAAAPAQRSSSERRQDVLQLLRRTGPMTIAQVAQALNVSVITARCTVGTLARMKEAQRLGTLPDGSSLYGIIAE